MHTRASDQSNPSSPEFRERPRARIYERPNASTPWLTPIVLPALLLLVVTTVLIYVLVQ